jgi:hypothetical protein
VEVKGLLDGAPIILGDQDGVAAFAGNLDWLVRIGHVIEEFVEEFSGFSGCDRGHGYLRAYDKAYVGCAAMSSGGDS